MFRIYHGSRRYLVSLLCAGACAALLSLPSARSVAAAGVNRSSLAPVGSLAIGASRVRIAGQFAYLGSTAALQIVAVADPAHPALRGSYPTPVADLQVVGHLVYIADGVSDLRIVDATDPAHPALRGTYRLPNDHPDTTTGQTPTRLAVEGGLAYIIYQETLLALPPYGAELVIVDVSAPAAPRLVSRTTIGPFFANLQVAGGFVYIAGPLDVGATLRIFNDYLSVIDARNPAAPQQVTRLAIGCSGLSCPNSAGGLALAGGGLAYGTSATLTLIDVSDPLQLTTATPSVARRSRARWRCTSGTGRAGSRSRAAC